VSRDAASFAAPCLYCQVAPRAGDARADADAADGATADVTFTPPPGADLDALFAAMTRCAELWPDADADGADDPFGLAAMLEASAGGGGACGGGAGVTGVPGQFDDA